MRPAARRCAGFANRYEHGVAPRGDPDSRSATNAPGAVALKDAITVTDPAGIDPAQVSRRVRIRQIPAARWWTCRFLAVPTTRSATVAGAGGAEGLPLPYAGFEGRVQPRRDPDLPPGRRGRPATLMRLAADPAAARAGAPAPPSRIVRPRSSFDGRIGDPVHIPERKTGTPMARVRRTPRFAPDPVFPAAAGGVFAQSRPLEIDIVGGNAAAAPPIAVVPFGGDAGQTRYRRHHPRRPGPFRPVPHHRRGRPPERPTSAPKSPIRPGACSSGISCWSDAAFRGERATGSRHELFDVG